MAFDLYPDNIATSIYVDKEIQLSDITSDVNTQARYLGVQLFKYGPNTGVNMYVKAYDVSDTLLATSETLRVKQIPSDTDYFYGWFYFKFEPRVTMDTVNPVRFKLLLENYTFSESSWIGAIYDWPTTMGYGNSTQIQGSPFALDLIGAN